MGGVFDFDDPWILLSASPDSIAFEEMGMPQALQVGK
jgi:hypothetical protein